MCVLQDTNEANWLEGLLSCLAETQVIVTRMHCDNRSAIAFNEISRNWHEVWKLQHQFSPWKTKIKQESWYSMDRYR